MAAPNIPKPCERCGALFTKRDAHGTRSTRFCSAVCSSRYVADQQRRSGTPRQPGRWERQWRVRVGALARWAEAHGHTSPPPSANVDGIAIGQWVNQLRAAHRALEGGISRGKIRLTPTRIADLEALPGWSWSDSYRDHNWEIGFAALLAWTASAGHAIVPYSYVDADGLMLGKWVTRQRRRFVRGVLAEDRRQRLEAIAGWRWDALSLTAAGRSYKEAALAAELEAIMGETTDGHHVATSRGTEHCDVVLTSHRVVIEYDGRHWHDSPEAQERDQRKTECLSEAGWWVLRIRETPLPMLSLHDRSVSPTGSDLAVVVEALDGLRDLGVLSARSVGQYKRRARLRNPTGVVERMGAVAGDAHWTERYDRLLSFVKMNGHALVTATHIEVDGMRLGEWVALQRKFYRQGRMKPQRRELLEQVSGWAWKPPTGNAHPGRRAVPRGPNKLPAA